jgi:hypothetical protein
MPQWNFDGPTPVEEASGGLWDAAGRYFLCASRRYGLTVRGLDAADFAFASGSGARCFDSHRRAERFLTVLHSGVATA